MTQLINRKLKPFLRYTLRRPLLRFRKSENPYKDFNDRHRTIFIHIPKTGGVSIEKTLFNEQVGHQKLNRFQYYDPIRFDSYFKFTFVRNPWDRLVSAYFFLKQGGKNSVDAKFSEAFLSPYDSFEKFVRALHNKKFRRKILNWQHFRPQIDFITDYKGRITLDYIGRFETIETDFAILADKLAIQATLTHENKSKRKKEYQTYYSDETAEIVADIYQEDIRKLVYSFNE